MMPPMNSLPRETSAKRVSTIIVVLGGISGPRTPPQHKAPSANPRSYPCFSYCGTATLPTVMMTPPLWPMIAPIAPSPTILAATSPPGTRDSHLLAAPNSSSPTSVSAMMQASRKNSGRGASWSLKRKEKVVPAQQVHDRGAIRDQADDQGGDQHAEGDGHADQHHDDHDAETYQSGYVVHCLHPLALYRHLRTSRRNSRVTEQLGNDLYELPDHYNAQKRIAYGNGQLHRPQRLSPRRKACFVDRVGVGHGLPSLPYQDEARQTEPGAARSSQAL